MTSKRDRDRAEGKADESAADKARREVLDEIRKKTPRYRDLDESKPLWRFLANVGAYRTATGEACGKDLGPFPPVSGTNRFAREFLEDAVATMYRRESCTTSSKNPRKPDRDRLIVLLAVQVHRELLTEKPQGASHATKVAARVKKHARQLGRLPDEDLIEHGFDPELLQEISKMSERSLADVARDSREEWDSK